MVSGNSHVFDYVLQSSICIVYLFVKVRVPKRAGRNVQARASTLRLDVASRRVLERVPLASLVMCIVQSIVN